MQRLKAAQRIMAILFTVPLGACAADEDPLREFEPSELEMSEEFLSPGASLAAPEELGAQSEALESAVVASVPVNYRVLASFCKYRDQANQIQWKGENRWLPTRPIRGEEDRPRGRFYYCLTKYKMEESDPRGDYYAVSLDLYNTVTKGNSDWTARAMAGLATNIFPTDNVFGSTPDISSEKSCTQQVDLGVSLGWFSASVPIQMCRGTNVVDNFRAGAPDGPDLFSAGWLMHNFGKVRRISLILDEKVPQGSPVPTFTSALWVPRNDYKFDEVTTVWSNTYAQAQYWDSI